MIGAFGLAAFHANTYEVGAISIPIMVGNVAVLISMSNVIVLSVDPKTMGVQTGMNQTFRNLGSALGLSSSPRSWPATPSLQTFGGFSFQNYNPRDTTSSSSGRGHRDSGVRVVARAAELQVLGGRKKVGPSGGDHRRRDSSDATLARRDIPAGEAGAALGELDAALRADRLLEYPADLPLAAALAEKVPAAMALPRDGIREPADGLVAPLQYPRIIGELRRETV